MASTALTVTPTHFALGDIQVQFGYAPLRFTVTNTGSTDLTFGLEYPFRAPFERFWCWDGQPLFSLPPGASCAFDTTLFLEHLMPSEALGPGTEVLQLVINGGERRIPLTVSWNAVPIYLAVDTSPLDFGNVIVDGRTVTLARAIRNNGPGMLSVGVGNRVGPSFSCTFLGGRIAHPTCPREHGLAAKSIEISAQGCDALVAGQTCLLLVRFTPAAAFAVGGSIELSYQANGLFYSRSFEVRGAGVAARTSADAVLAVEYYNPALAHYFVTAFESEKAVLDAGGNGGWVRTGRSFWVYPNVASAPVGTDPVCRYYGVPGVGPNSHFYSAIEAECEVVSRLFSREWLLETSDAFAAHLPDAEGNCPAGTSPLYRLWNQRPNTNHRYTTDPVIPSEMNGWIREGYGIAGVAMCVPQ